MVAYPNLRPTYVIALKYFMAFDTMFYPLSFRARNIRHTKPRDLGYRQWYTKPGARILAPGALHVPNHMPLLE